jgi:hypothetical protein
MGWDHFKIEPYVTKFADAVGLYHEKVEDLKENLDKIEAEINLLEKCQFDNTTISQIISKIQGIVDVLVINNYTNLDSWIEELDKRVRYNLYF